MNEIGANGARTHLIELLERAEDGEEIIIEAHGKAIVKIAPIPPKHDMEAARAAAEQIRKLSQKYASRGITLEEIKSWVNEGRK